jgi:hypothetical protein
MLLIFVKPQFLIGSQIPPAGVSASCKPIHHVRQATNLDSLLGFPRGDAIPMLPDANKIKIHNTKISMQYILTVENAQMAPGSGRNRRFQRRG